MFYCSNFDTSENLLMGGADFLSLPSGNHSFRFSSLERLEANLPVWRETNRLEENLPGWRET